MFTVKKRNRHRVQEYGELRLWPDRASAEAYARARKLKDGWIVLEQKVAAPIRIFVYGTLKSGYHNHYLLQGSRLVMEQAYTCLPFAVLEPSFPVLMQDGKRTGLVRGEVYEVSAETLRHLDRLEGEGRMYDRKYINVQPRPGAGEPVEVQAYIGCAPMWTRYHDLNTAEPNADGIIDWVPRHLRTRDYTAEAQA